MDPRIAALARLIATLRKPEVRGPKPPEPATEPTWYSQMEQDFRNWPGRESIPLDGSIYDRVYSPPDAAVASRAIPTIDEQALPRLPDEGEDDWFWRWAKQFRWNQMPWHQRPR